MKDKKTLIFEKIQNLSSPRPVIGIDGFVGAGKSTLASEISEQFNGIVISVDQLYDQWFDLFESADKLEKIHIKINEAITRYKSHEMIEIELFDWEKRLWAKKDFLPEHKILVLEGVGALHSKLRGNFDFTLYLEIELNWGIERSLIRDKLESTLEITTFANYAQLYLQQESVAKNADFELKV